ncbi:hypothetical protein PUN28_017238 [Cardiocondyla obscurior]|uniref:Uncharacterized protein n=1 Tax=Cardiocondyla obscurior TaxID=286306 RepID=A0AAW2EKV1_9HYME
MALLIPNEHATKIKIHSARARALLPLAAHGRSAARNSARERSLLSASYDCYERRKTGSEVGHTFRRDGRTKSAGNERSLHDRLRARPFTAPLGHELRRAARFRCLVQRHDDSLPHCVYKHEYWFHVLESICHIPDKHIHLS